MNIEFKNKFKVERLGILNFNYWVVSVRPKQPTIGSLVISLKRDCKHLNNLTEAETQELSKVFSDTEHLLKKAFSYDKINYLCLMMVDEHVHFHVIPRYEKQVEFNDQVYIDNDWPTSTVITSYIEEPKIELKILEYLKQQNVTKPYTIGYTTGIYDLFHIGHLNILQKAKDACDYLIVGVTTDELAFKLKGKKPIIPFNERLTIIRHIDFVDEVVPQKEINELNDFKKLKFDKIFKGSDWKGTEKWNNLEKEFAKVGVEIIYFPYTQSTSSTIIRKILEEKIIER
jgi:glycerol-3-phosphate cytidylyltransferase